MWWDSFVTVMQSIYSINCLCSIDWIKKHIIRSMSCFSCTHTKLAIPDCNTSFRFFEAVACWDKNDDDGHYQLSNSSIKGKSRRGKKERKKFRLGTYEYIPIIQALSNGRTWNMIEVLFFFFFSVFPSLWSLWLLLDREQMMSTIASNDVIFSRFNKAQPLPLSTNPCLLSLVSERQHVGNIRF